MEQRLLYCINLPYRNDLLLQAKLNEDCSSSTPSENNAVEIKLSYPQAG